MEMRAARLGLGLLLVTAILSAPAMAQKTPDLRLGTDLPGTAASLSPQIAASGDSVYVTWADQRNGESDIYFNRSLDGGATWLESDIRLNTDLAGVAISSSPQLVASGNRVYVAWEDGRNGELDIYFNRSLDGGLTWLSSDLRLDTDPIGSAASELPQIAVSEDCVYVTWQDARNASEGVYLNRSADAGAIWGANDIRLDSDAPGSYPSFAPQIATSGDSVYVVWADRINSNPPGQWPSYSSRAQLNCSKDRGATWLASEVRVDAIPAGRDSGFVVANLQIAAQGDRVHVFWTNWYQASDVSWAEIESNHSVDAGATWLPADNVLNHVSDPDTRRGRPQIALSGDSIYVIWEDRRGSLGVDTEVYFNRSLDGGASWLPSDLRIDSGVPGRLVEPRPQITAAENAIYVTWLSHRDGKEDIYFDRSLDGGLTWLDSDIRLDTENPVDGVSLAPQIASSGDSVYVVWSDDRNGSEDVYFNIPFGAQPFGEGNAGSGAIVPRLEGTDSLTLGSSFTLSVSDGLGGAFGMLLLGGPNSKTALPMLGGSLLIDPIQQVVPIRLDGVPGVAGDGTYSVAIPIPDENVLLGFNVNLQALFIDPGAPGNIAWTSGVEAWIL